MSDVGEIITRAVHAREFDALAFLPTDLNVRSTAVLVRMQLRMIDDDNERADLRAAIRSRVSAELSAAIGDDESVTVDRSALTSTGERDVRSWMNMTRADTRAQTPGGRRDDAVDARLAALERALARANERTDALEKDLRASNERAQTLLTIVDSLLRTTESLSESMRTLRSTVVAQERRNIVLSETMTRMTSAMSTVFADVIGEAPTGARELQQALVEQPDADTLARHLSQAIEGVAAVAAATQHMSDGTAERARVMDEAQRILDDSADRREHALVVNARVSSAVLAAPWARDDSEEQEEQEHDPAPTAESSTA